MERKDERPFGLELETVEDAQPIGAVLDTVIAGLMLKPSFSSAAKFMAPTPLRGEAPEPLRTGVAQKVVRLKLV